IRMKGLACLCPDLPNFLELRPCFMAESSRTQAPGQGPPVNIQFLRAQYEGLRRLQRTQAHLMVLPKEGTTSTPAESMTSAIWINKERRSSLLQEETDSEVEGMLEEADRNCHQARESPWHIHLEMYRLVQNSHQETSHQGKPKGQLEESKPRLSPEGNANILEKDQKTQQGTIIPEATQCQNQVGSTLAKAAGSSLQANSVWCLPSTKNPHRSGKRAYYPFPQRKTPRISQAARNLGLYPA
uniref:RIKEN cDNA D630039A03 gene n=1 Tax=Nannospalax galili TaxID=1026970 RepID=A0A8C6RQ73_NANGA